MREHAGGRRSIGKEAAPVLLSRHAQTDGILLHRDRAVAHNAIKAHARNVQDVDGMNRCSLPVSGCIDVDQAAVLIPVDFHAVWQ
ncbi:hypothetical protein SDC9_140016 [bioreactor metagenome]|uniref:Uncharacterized protein n=1 Tax=bioreactor metagenome TaxID=1076179 RepID=A0A645DTR3_9ZZZZ